MALTHQLLMLVAAAPTLLATGNSWQALSHGQRCRLLSLLRSLQAHQSRALTRSAMTLVPAQAAMLLRLWPRHLLPCSLPLLFPCRPPLRLCLRLLLALLPPGHHHMLSPLTLVAMWF